MINRATVKSQLAATAALLHELENHEVEISDSDGVLFQVIEKLRDSTEILRREIYTDKFNLEQSQ